MTPREHEILKIIQAEYDYWNDAELEDRSEAEAPVYDLAAMIAVGAIANLAVAVGTGRTLEEHEANIAGRSGNSRKTFETSEPPEPGCVV